MTLRVSLAAQWRRWASHLEGAMSGRTPWWMGLAVLLVACGQAVAAAPPGTAGISTGHPATPTRPALASPTRPPNTEPAGATPAATLTPLGPANTPTPSPVLPQALVASPAGPTDPAPLPATATPTAQIKPQPTLGAFSITPLAGATLVTPNPTAVSPQNVGQSIVNVLLIGTDLRPIDPTFRTDTLIVVSINKDSGTVSLLSIPRDLFVYIPTFGMARINRAYQLAGSVGFHGGSAALLEQTILYNLGIPIQYYALVNFDGFRKVVDTLGGIDVPVNCQVTEYKIKDPTLDERVVANYELYTQAVGLTHMDGSLALWFARARPVGGDFFRGYRQRQVLRAIYHKGLSANIIPEIPALYSSFRDVVQTDMGLWDVMQFVPLAAHMDDANIRSFNIGPNQTTGWTTPDGQDVLLPNADAIALVTQDFLNGKSANLLARPLTWVEISNAAPGAADDVLAAETLHNEGFAVRSGPAPADSNAAATTIVDYTTSAKGSPIKRLQSILHVADQNVMPQPDANNPVKFQVILGANYNPCPRLDWMDPGPTPTPTP